MRDMEIQKKQAIGILEKLKADLKTKGLSLADVTYLRVYVAPDPNKGNTPDYQGWFDAYALFFNTKENPVKNSPFYCRGAKSGFAGLSH
ncbi:hypothetical protein RCO48_34440 [Peribacillus frigoritolerans]|nr:hypothetical protein [Peribacillus frigoritolerans]